MLNNWMDFLNFFFLDLTVLNCQQCSKQRETIQLVAEW